MAGVGVEHPAPIGVDDREEDGGEPLAGVAESVRDPAEGLAGLREDRHRRHQQVLEAQREQPRLGAVTGDVGNDHPDPPVLERPDVEPVAGEHALGREEQRVEAQRRGRLHRGEEDVAQADDERRLLREGLVGPPHLLELRQDAHPHGIDVVAEVDDLAGTVDDDGLGEVTAGNAAHRVLEPVHRRDDPLVEGRQHEHQDDEGGDGGAEQQPQETVLGDDQRRLAAGRLLVELVAELADLVVEDLEPRPPDVGDRGRRLVGLAPVHRCDRGHGRLVVPAVVRPTGFLERRHETGFVDEEPAQPRPRGGDDRSRFVVGLEERAVPGDHVPALAALLLPHALLEPGDLLHRRDEHLPLLVDDVAQVEDDGCGKPDQQRDAESREDGDRQHPAPEGGRQGRRRRAVSISQAGTPRTRCGGRR